MNLKTLLIWLLITVVSSFGTYLYKGYEAKQEIEKLETSLSDKSDSLGLLVDRVVYLDSKVNELRALDSLNKNLITGNQLLIKELNQIVKKQSIDIEGLNNWKLDAQDGIIYDTVFVKKRFLGGFKVI